MNLFRYTFLLFFVVEVGICYSQHLRNYDLISITEEDGLPSNEVYHAIEDHEGFIWFATDNGLCRYNGSKFKIYDTRHGLPTKSIFHLFPQSDSSIVGVCSDARFFKIKDDKITPIIEKKNYEKYINALNYPFAYYKDSKGNHHIGTRYGYYSFNSQSKLIDADTSEVNYGAINYWMTDNNEPFCYIRKYKDNIGKFNVQFAGEKIETIQGDFGNYRSLYPSSNKRYTFLHCEKQIILVENTTKNVVSLPFDGFCLGGKIYDDYLHVFTYRGGVLVYDISEGKLDYQYTVEPKYSVSSLLKSKDGIVYLTTLENGVKALNSFSPIIAYSAKKDNNITAISSRQESLIIGFESGEIYLEKEGEWFTSHRKIYDLQIKNDFIFASSDRHYFLNPKTRVFKEYGERKPDESIFSNAIFPINDSLVALTGKDYFRIENIWNKENLYEKQLKKERFNKGIVIGETVFLSYFGGIHIINFFSENKSNYIPTESPVINFYRHEGKNFAINENMFILQFDSKIRSKTSIPFPASVYNLFSCVYKNGILHVSTNEGVFSWKLDSQGKPSHLVNFDPISMVRNLHLCEDTILYATNKTIYKAALRDLKVDIPTVFIESITIKDSVFSSRQIEVSYALNTFEITSENISLKEPFIHYRYRLDGNERDYLYTNNGKITYSSLSPGKYIFKVSGTSDGFNYSQEKTIEIVIFPPFWSTWWFITSVIIIIGVFAFLFIRIRINQIRKKIEIKETISKLRSQALMAQLNPHLVFNILNAIQGMVSKGKVEESNIYIARFSKFLRSSLSYSKQSICTLEDEIRLINQYLELERLRFGVKIDFFVEINAEDLTFKVPPLITQPLIENAIKHGVTPSKSSNKRIEIRFNQKEEVLNICVTDNGLGFKDDFKKNDGLRITEERIKGLSNMNEMNIESQNGSTTVQLKIVKND